MGENHPLVSVIVPTYYRNELLQETLQSVDEQSYAPIEIVVVDDSGEGHARPVATEFADVRYLAFNENQGANAARTRGAELARGRYVHFLDDDDLFYEEKIERQVQTFRETDDVGVVYTGIKKVSKEKSSTIGDVGVAFDKQNGQTVLPDPAVRGSVLVPALSFSMWPCMTSTMLIDSEILDLVLPFPDRKGAQDLEMMIQLARRTKFDYVDAPLVYKRLGLNSLGSSMAAVECRKQLIEDYTNLYDRYPASVRRTALATTYETEGALLLQKQGWSPKAIWSLLKHVYYMPNDSVKSVSKLVAACFGNPGWRFLSRLNRAVQR